jgi:hypothetical protein
MKILFLIVALFVCVPAFGQRYISEVADRAALKVRKVGSLDKTVFIRCLVTLGDGGGGIYTITNSNVGADNFLRIQSTDDPAWSYDRWMIPAIGIFNFGDQFTIINNSNVTLNSTALSLTNIIINGSTTTPAIELGAVCGTANFDPSAGSEFNLLLTCDTVLIATNSWQDFHNVSITMTNTGNFSLTISTPAYDQYWYPTGNSTQVTNDWGSGIVNRFALWKTGGRILGSQKEGLSVDTLTKEVYSGNYGGLLPTDVPVVSAALNYDLDSPGVMYFWNGVNWY